MTRASWERIDVLIRFLITGGKALAFGFLIWYSLIALNVLFGALVVPRYPSDKPRWPFYFFRSDWGLGLIYGGTFFLAAMLAARSRWSLYPACAAFAAYAAFLLVVLPVFDRLIDFEFELCILLLPLLTAPVGAWFGCRAFRRLHH